MYDLNDTIIAISSPPSGARAIVRLTGPKTITICEQIFSPAGSSIIHRPSSIAPRLIAGSIAIDNELEIDAHLYLFLAPHSYTGDDVAEIHVHTNRSVIEALMNSLLGSHKTGSLSKGLRMAGPGEFTARAYLNSKIDLAQAEAVNEIVVSSNCYQLAAAEKLLSGRLAQTTDKVCSAIMDSLSLIEAGLDFSSEDIEFITGQEAAEGSQPPFFAAEVPERLAGIKDQLEQLLSTGIRYESVIDLPAVGIAGAPNAGKSSLLNKLLGKERSIVSDQRKTTRDVLTGELLLAHCRCVLFDCAGLTRESSFVLRPSSDESSPLARGQACPCESRGTSDEGRTILDELAQQAAIQALRNSSVVVFCVDISKTDWTEDISAYRAIRSKFEIPPAKPAVIPVATKADLLPSAFSGLADRLARLNDLFGLRRAQSSRIKSCPPDVRRACLSADKFIPVSVISGAGLNELADTIDRKIIEKFEIPRESGVALTARLRSALTLAIENISESINELKAGNDEVATMILRAAYQGICDIEQPAHWQVDEQILEKIFSRFCIGK